MTAQHNWRRGQMKEKLGAFEPGEDVIIGKSTLQFSNPALMGEGFWLLSVTEDKCLLVADGDPSFGKGLTRLVKLGVILPSDKQERCTKRAKELMPDSAYTPKNRKKLTYFFGNRPTKRISETEFKYGSN